MDRKEAYYNIQQFGYGPELQKKFGKPYSSVSSAELIPAVEEMLKASKEKNKLPKPEKDEASKPKKENPNPKKKEEPEKKEDELSFVERVKLGRQYVNKINELKARKAYMEKSLEIIIARDDLSIRIGTGGSIGYYTFRNDGKI